MNWRRLGEVAALSAVLFVALPFAVTTLGIKFADGVLIGTGIAIAWYTLETLDLRRETAKLRQETARQSELAFKQIDVGIEQNRIALEQADAAISPLVVTRLEDVLDPPPSAPYLPQTSYRRFVPARAGPSVAACGCGLSLTVAAKTTRSSDCEVPSMVREIGRLRRLPCA